jgi:hypothetical protein
MEDVNRARWLLDCSSPLLLHRGTYPVSSAQIRAQGVVHGDVNPGNIVLQTNERRLSARGVTENPPWRGDLRVPIKTSQRSRHEADSRSRFANSPFAYHLLPLQQVVTKRWRKSYAPVTLECNHPLGSLRTDSAIPVPGSYGRGAQRRERILKKQVLHSRRHHKRVETPDGVSAFWRCGRTEDTSRISDVSIGGLFLETLKVCAVDATVELHFLVEDGEITAHATVRYVKAGSGLGLQFKSVRNEDQVRFASMIKRLIDSEIT